MVTGAETLQNPAKGGISEQIAMQERARRCRLGSL
jgi:hypothetical protein